MTEIDKLAIMRHLYTSKFISEYIPTGSRVLEIGGDKQTPYWLQTKGKYNLVTVNLNEPADYVMNIEKDTLKILGENFSYVTMFEVVEHMENPI